MMTMNDSEGIILGFLQTEKGTTQNLLNKYRFRVNATANKEEIKKAVENLYKVHCTKVNTLKVHGRWKRVRRVAGKTPDWKKAIVTIKAGEKIEVT